MTVPVPSCLSVSVSVRTCPHLPCLANVHAPYICVHPCLSWPSAPVHTRLMLLPLWPDPGQGAAGCPAAEGAPPRGPHPALPQLPAAHGAAHGGCAGAGRGGCLSPPGARHQGLSLLRRSLPGLFCPRDPGPPLLPPVPAQEDAASPLAVLEELTSGDCRQDLATNLVKLFLGQGLAGPFLDYLTRREVTRTSELPA